MMQSMLVSDTFIHGQETKSGAVLKPTERAYFSEIISGYNSELTQKLNRLLAVFLLIHHITDPDHSETETQLPCDSDYTSNVLSERSWKQAEHRGHMVSMWVKLTAVCWDGNKHSWLCLLLPTSQHPLCLRVNKRAGYYWEKIGLRKWSGEHTSVKGSYCKTDVYIQLVS